jgi:hypothetical protein
VSARFGSAEDMRHAWVSILGAPARSQKSTKSVESSAAEEGTEETAQERVSDETLAAILADTPIATLPLSVRARNALDRAGLTKMIDMLALGSNRLSAVRGVGRQVAKEILELRDRWQALRTVSAAEVPPFFPGYAGEDFHVSMVSLGRELAAGLLEGGLPTLRAVAQAPSSQVEHLAKVHAFDLAAVRKTLAAENEKANQRAKPTTLEGWMDALLPPRKGRKDLHLVRALYGLEAPFAGRLDVTVRELADREKKDPRRHLHRPRKGTLGLGDALRVARASRGRVVAPGRARRGRPARHDRRRARADDSAFHGSRRGRAHVGGGARACGRRARKRQWGLAPFAAPRSRALGLSLR